VWFPLFLLADNDLTLLENDLRSKRRDAMSKATNPGMKGSKTPYLVAIFAWLVAAAGGCLPANAQSFAYVANQFDNTVSAFKIDSTTGALSPVGSFAAGDRPPMVKNLKRIEKA
jgi:hypothetical protein